LPGSGHGIVGMRERAMLLGGTLQAGPRQIGGFQVVARLPIRGESSS
jgi:signal transduction histidine kinase